MGNLFGPGLLVSMTVYYNIIQLLKSKTKEIEQLEEKLSSIGEQGRIPADSQTAH